jgi:hypothetical protein
MAQRLPIEAVLLDRPVNGAVARCRNCGGSIELEERQLPESRFPRRRLCRVCGTEYGTTRTVERNY